MGGYIEAKFSRSFFPRAGGKGASPGNLSLLENYQTSSGTNSAKGGQFVQLVKTW